MADSETPTSRARLFKWLAVLVAAVLVAAAVAVVFLPDLLPSEAVRREVAAMLSERLGRPVTVGSARLDWREGLTVTGVRIGRPDGEGLLARADRLTVVFGPLEVARAAAGRDARVETLRFDGLELWLVLDEDGRWNVADLLEGEPMDVGMVQVGGARVHFLNRRTGGRLDFESVHASVGELASTGHGYVSLSADLCPEAGAAAEAVAPAREAPSPLREQRGTAEPQRAPVAPPRCGHVVVTANLDRLHVGPDEMPVGSMKAEWSHLPWPRLWAAVAPDSALAGALRETSGRMSATVGQGTWSAEGAVQAGRLAWPAGRDRPPTALLPEAILGFRLHRASASAPVVLDLVKFSAPGLDLKMTGTVAPARPATGEDADADPGRPWPIPALDLDAAGAVTWGPLCQSAAPLRPLLETFDRLGGTAQIGLHVTTAGEGLRLKASADLSDTVMVAEGQFVKGEHDPLRLRLEGTCDRRFRTISDGLLDVVTGGARLRLKGTAPVDGLIEAVTGTGPDGADVPARVSRLAGAQGTATAEVQDTARVLALVPALDRRLGPLQARGPYRIELAVQPLGAADGAGTAEEAAAGPPARAAGPGTAPPAWTAVLHADFIDTALDLRVPGGSKKPPGTLARLDADAVFWPAIRRSDVRRLAVQLGDGSIAWDGSARIDWPRKEGEQPVGRFEGTLTLDGIAKAGSILAPERFGPAPPVAGGAVFDVAADLAEGRLRTHMEAGLGRMDLRLGRYLVKPAGRAASLALTSLWHTGRWNRVEGDADLDLPGVHLSALGQATLVAQWQDYPAAPRARSAVAVTLGPKSTVEIKASVSDVRRAAALSPLLAETLKRGQADGRTEARVVLSLQPDGLQATGQLDLTETALDLGTLLKKPAGRVLRARVAGDIAPHPRGWIDVRLATAEVHLGESVTRVGGRVRLDWAGLAAPVKPAARLAAALDEADVTVEADWRHGPALGRMLPWLAPLRRRCGLEGPTRWTLALSGTPTRGRVDLDLDATDCRVSAVAYRQDAGEAETVTVKKAGVPASARLKVRYGEVPGEMVVEEMEVYLAEATASASGRLLFDDPRLLVPEAPAAWTLQVEAQVPDAAILASLLPWRLADLEPTGAVTVNLLAAADAKGTEVESCRLRFDAARILWLGRRVRLDGPVAYDHERLETDGLDVKVGDSDVRLVTYIARPNDDPTGSVIVRGTALDLAEVQEMIRQTSESLVPGDAEESGDQEATGGGVRLGEHLHRLLARAHLSADVRLDRVTLVVPKWEARYDLENLEAEGRLAEGHLVMPRFRCRLNRGTVTGQMRLDFRQDPPVLHVAYDARDLAMAENLKPFIDTTFPGMKVFGTLSTRATRMQPLAAGAHPVGRSETVLTDGVLDGPGAPDYITNLLPGLKLTRYHFNRMTNVSEQRPDGVTDNRMLFDGKAYDLFIFGVTHPDGRTRYTLGVDLLLSLGSEAISRTLGQGKLPLMHYNGRIVGSEFAERDIAYVLPHEFAYDVFLRRNLLLELIRSLGRPEPKIEKPLVVPREERRIEPRS